MDSGHLAAHFAIHVGSAAIYRGLCVLLLQVDEPTVWSELANAYLDHSQVHDAIAAYLRAADTSKYNEVIEKANQVRWWGLVRNHILHSLNEACSHCDTSSWDCKLPLPLLSAAAVRPVAALPSACGPHSQLSFPALHSIHILLLFLLQSGDHDDLVKYLLMVRKKVKDPSDFEWLKQCRFYWRDDRDTVIISICDVEQEYSYEFRE
jgi:hypothetical protein